MDTTEERAHIRALWRDRVETEIALISDTVYVAKGVRLMAGAEGVIRRQLERLIVDVVEETRAEVKP